MEHRSKDWKNLGRNLRKRGEGKRVNGYVVFVPLFLFFEGGWCMWTNADAYLMPYTDN